jgi:phenylacetate-CoA ligase
VGVKPADIDDIKDLAKIPITTKSELQNLPLNEIIAKNVPINKCKGMIISGPSGQPLKIFFTRKDYSFLEMIWARGFLENGLKLTDKRASIEYGLPFKSWVQHLGIWRKELLSVENDPESQASILEKMNPDVVTGYPFDLELLARMIKKKEVLGMRPRLVFSIGSFLDKKARDIINSAFGVEVFDYYASGELGCMAWECSEHNGYHMNIDAFIMEFLKDGNPAVPGEKGRIICTALHSYAMPLIRYETGDVGISSDEPCPCGRGLPLMSCREGQANTFIVTGSGKLVSPCLLVNILKVIPGIVQYKLVQERKGELKIQLSKGKVFSSETVNHLVKGLKEALGDGMNIEIRVVEKIPPDPPGRIHSIISKAPLGF